MLLFILIHSISDLILRGLINLNHGNAADLCRPKLSIQILVGDGWFHWLLSRLRNCIAHSLSSFQVLGGLDDSITLFLEVYLGILLCLLFSHGLDFGNRSLGISLG